MPTSDDGAGNYWVTIDVAAQALSVTIAYAYVLAARDHWRRTRTQPRGYLMTDIRTTARNRRNRRTT